MSQASQDTLATVVLLVLFAVYFIPTAVAFAREHHNLGSIFIINLFLGWTLLGWVIALAMAFSAVKNAPALAEPQVPPPLPSDKQPWHVIGKAS